METKINNIDVERYRLYIAIMKLIYKSCVIFIAVHITIKFHLI